MNRQTRLNSLYETADAEIESLPGVHATEKQSFRMGASVFVRIDVDDDVRAYCFKLPGEAAQSACSKYSFITPMKFGGMGKKGWVSFRLTRKNQLSSLRKLIAQSHALQATR